MGKPLSVSWFRTEEFSYTFGTEELEEAEVYDENGNVDEEALKELICNMPDTNQAFTGCTEFEVTHFGEEGE